MKKRAAYSRWTESKIINEIRRLHEEGTPLTVQNISRAYSSLYSAALRYFKGWNHAVVAAGIDYPSILHASRRLAAGKITKWTRERVVVEIRKIPPEKLWFIYKTDIALHSAARREFGTWKRAIESAGYSYDYINKIAPTKYTTWSREKIIQMIRSLTAEQLTYGRMTKEHLLLYSAAYRKFGNWSNALQAAGFNEEQIMSFFSNRKWTAEKILATIQEMYKKKKKLGSGWMQKNEPSLFSAAFRRFGSWGNAIQAAGLDYNVICRNKNHT